MVQRSEEVEGVLLHMLPLFLHDFTSYLRDDELIRFRDSFPGAALKRLQIIDIRLMLYMLLDCLFLLKTSGLKNAMRLPLALVISEFLRRTARRSSSNVAYLLATVVGCWMFVQVLLDGTVIRQSLRLFLNAAGASLLAASLAAPSSRVEYQYVILLIVVLAMAVRMAALILNNLDQLDVDSLGMTLLLYLMSRQFRRTQLVALCSYWTLQLLLDFYCRPNHVHVSALSVSSGVRIAGLSALLFFAYERLEAWSEWVGPADETLNRLPSLISAGFFVSSLVFQLPLRPPSIAAQYLWSFLGISVVLWLYHIHLRSGNYLLLRIESNSGSMPALLLSGGTWISLLLLRVVALLDSLRSVLTQNRSSDWLCFVPLVMLALILHEFKVLFVLIYDWYTRTSRNPPPEDDRDRVRFLLDNGYKVIAIGVNGALVTLGISLSISEADSLLLAMLFLVHGFVYVVMATADLCRAIQLAYHSENSIRAMPRGHQPGELCPICYEPLEELVRALCTHQFHELCLRRWLRIQATCPACRMLLVDSNSFI